MNSLSWLIYLGDVAEALKLVAGGVAGLIFVVCLVLAPMIIDECSGATIKKIAALTLILGFVAIVIPSQRTIYMIAASEMGERVVSQPETKEMLGDLREVIAKQIKKLKDDK